MTERDSIDEAFDAYAKENAGIVFPGTVNAAIAPFCALLFRAGWQAALASREAEKREPLTIIVTDAIDGYKAGLACEPIGIVSEAFDCGWITGQAERSSTINQEKPKC